MNKEEFVTFVANEISKNAPDKTVVVENSDNFGLLISFVSGTTGIVSLDNIHRAYLSQRHSGEFSALIKNLISSVTVEPKQIAMDVSNFENIKKSIYPFIKPKAFLNFPGVGRLSPTHTGFAEDLIITYVVDYSDSVAGITEKHLLNWDINMDELHKLAMSNFLKDKDIPPVKILLSNYLAAFTYNAGDSYDATRILLAHRLEETAKRMPHKALIGIPNRDFLIVFPDTVNVKNKFRQLIREDAKTKAYGISDSIYSLIDGRLIKIA